MKKMLWVILLTSIFAVEAAAGSFQVAPMRLSIDEGSKISNITVFNKNDAPANMQVRAMRWNQDNEAGADIMIDSKELIIFPKVFTVPAHGQRVIRVGHKGKGLTRELAYRLLIRELPVDEPGRMGMKFAVQMSMPVFIKPKGARKAALPMLSGIEVHEGKFSARVLNKGNVYFMLKSLTLTGSKAGQEVYTGKGNGWYILAGASKLFKIDMSQDECNSMDSLKLVAKSKQGNTEASYPIDADICAEIAVPKATSGDDAS
ncbi:MAG: molecular chaperone [Mariprofundus sp.]|nr:molecular chaperone [Mariprofundus sp.]